MRSNGRRLGLIGFSSGCSSSNGLKLRKPGIMVRKHLRAGSPEERRSDLDIVGEVATCGVLVCFADPRDPQS